MLLLPSSFIAQASRKLAARAVSGDIKPEDIDEQMLAAELATGIHPDPDLFIRTGGEKRISNFLIWQAAYAEYYPTPAYWPDFGREELYEAIVAYNQRERRFGLVKENN